MPDELFEVPETRPARTANPLAGKLERLFERIDGGDRPCTTSDDMVGMSSHASLGESGEAPIISKSYVQWATNDGKVFYAVGKTLPILAPGAYTTQAAQDGSILFSPLSVNIDGLMRLPDTIVDRIVNEIETFWSPEAQRRFKKFKITQRRGVLIVGPTGCGKSCAAKLLAVDVVRRGGIVIPYTNPRLLIATLMTFREVQSRTPIVVLMEDIDEITQEGNSSTLLNVLDGVYAEFDRVVFVATSNHPDRLERRITNRPSRFDCVIKMEHPSAESRLLYFKGLMVDDPTYWPFGGETDAANIEQVIADTDNLSFAHLKELFTSVVVFEHRYADAIAKVKAMATEELPTGEDMERGANRGPMGLAARRSRR